jgi:hypothetical protein
MIAEKKKKSVGLCVWGGIVDSQSSRAEKRKIVSHQKCNARHKSQPGERYHYAKRHDACKWIGRERQ